MIVAHPSVGEAVVVGVPGEVAGRGDRQGGRGAQPRTASERELIAFCRERLANFKVPQVVEFRDEIPKSPLGKVLRKYLV